MSLTDKLNGLTRKEVANLKGIKRLKEREIVNLFVGVSDIVNNMRSLSLETKTALELKITGLEKDLSLLEERIKKLEPKTE